MGKRKREWAWCGTQGHASIRTTPTSTRRESMDIERWLDPRIVDWVLCSREVGPWKETKR